jgi:hypothetical protein
MKSCGKSARRAPDPFPTFTRCGVPDNFAQFDKAIDIYADEWIAALAKANQALSKRDRKRLKREDILFLVYTAVVYATRHHGKLTEAHLRLLHAALGIKRPSKRATEFIGLANVEEPNRFKMLSAADIEARDADISDRELARRLGVARGTIRNWRKAPSYNDRVAYIRALEKIEDELAKIRRAWKRRAQG